MLAAVVLAIIAILAIIAGIIYATTAEASLPSFLPGHQAGTGHHPIRAVAALVVGVALLVVAWFTYAYKAKASATAGKS